METDLNKPAQAEFRLNTAVLKKPIFFSIGYAVIALMFLLPFTEISCNGVTMAKASGTDLAFGFEMKPSRTINNLTGEFDRGDSGVNTNSSGRKKDPNSFALAAFILALGGLGFSFMKNSPRALLNFIITVLGTAAMIALMIDLKSDLSNEMKSGEGTAGIRITLDFTAWFYLTLIFFISLALISWRLWRDDKQPALPVETASTQHL